ncbi:carboxypeptidase regulatory-like domain-containing protein [Azohydromonas australica]|uniref:carboxypeptidase regulatory-like domain-containing protein n=1 Tax=Azohydromonas australica TaxID=364039 RepID=UPI00041CA59E|nr:carboxypeptidase regulatory-like domain-containing protein [Azohydromonas australica]
MKIGMTAIVIGAALFMGSGAALAASQQAGPEVIVGGAGAASQQAMRQAASQYGLGMTFATRNGDYVADVDVVIRDQKGHQVVSTVSEGPMMLVDLPGGRYQVEATYQGQEQQRQVTVPESGHRQLVMHW